MSTFPSLFLYNPENKRDKGIIHNEICSSYEESIPQAINSFFLRKSWDYMWIVTAKRGDGYNWNLHSPLEKSFKKLEVYYVTNDL